MSRISFGMLAGMACWNRWAGALQRLLLATLAVSALLVVPQAFSQKILTTIQIGGFTGQPAINTTTNMIYIPNQTTGAVAVINGQTNEIVTEIPVGPSIYAAAVNPKTNLIYVGGFSTSGYIAVIDGSSNTVTATIPVLVAGSIAVNPNTNLIYFSSGLGNVSVLDGATNQVIDTIATSPGCCIQGIEVNANTDRIYVAQIPLGQPCELAVIAGGNNKFSVADFPQIDDLDAIAVDSGLNRVYLSDAGGNVVTVIDGTTGKIIKTILPGYFSPIALNPANHLVATFGYSAQSESVFLAFESGLTYTPVGVQVPFPKTTDPKQLISGVNNRYYVTFYQHDGVTVVSGP
jgi:DNA-binding beta-propeller fold protein YncE